MGAGWEKLGDHSHLGVGTGLNCRAHASATGADNHYVIGVINHVVVGHGFLTSGWAERRQ